MQPKPVRGNVGFIAGTTLKQWDGDLVLTTSGEQVDGYDVRGRIVVKAAGCRVSNSIVRGLPTGIGYNSGLIDCTGPLCVDFAITASDLIPAVPSLWWNGILGHDYSASDIYTTDVVDGFGVYNTHDTAGAVNVMIEHSCWELPTWYAVDPNHRGGPVHADGVQIQSGSNIRVAWCNFMAYHSAVTADGPRIPLHTWPARQANSAVQVTQGVGPVDQVELLNNWFSGGGVATVNLSSHPASSMEFGRIEGNIFDGGSVAGYDVIMAPTTVCEIASNMRDDGSPARVNRRGA